MTTSTRPETAYDREVGRARRQFDEFIVNHEMTVLLDTLDDGTPYRHIRFARPDSNMYSFSLVTWPGHLSIGGDLSDFTFSRLYDMFAFFRGSVNPGYWGEKVVSSARGTEHGESKFSQDRYVEAVIDRVEWERDNLDEEDFASLMAKVQSDLLDRPASYIEEAREELEAFQWNSDSFENGYSFYNIYELDFGGYDHHFLLCIHAIQWGIAKYLTEFPDRFIPEGKR